MADSEKRQRRPSRRSLEALESQNARSRSPRQGAGKGRPQPSKPRQSQDGQGQGRGRGRGTSRHVAATGQGKGRGKRATHDSSLDLHDVQTQRRRNIKDLVDKLGEQDAKELLCIAIENDPSLLVRAGQEPPSPPPPPPPPPGPAPDWCVCTNCRPMPTDWERRCCRRAPANCVANSGDMAVAVLDPVVLYVLRMYRRDLVALHAVNEGDVNRQNRHAAYRSFVLWMWGRLVSGDRRVIPSCCVWKIRDKYPDPQHIYTGFIPGRLG